MSSKLLKMKSALAAAALACMAGAAMAQAGGSTVLDFEHVTTAGWNVTTPPTLIGDSDELYQAGFWMDPFSNTGAPRQGDLVGAIVDGAQLADTCFGIACPTNNSTRFYTMLNDAVVAFGAMDGSGFTVQGVDASFLGAAGEIVPGTAGILVMQGQRASDGEWLEQDFEIGGPDAFGNLSFSHFATTGEFAGTAFASVFVFGGACDASGDCTYFSSNRAQFALDNFAVTAVPEPNQWLLMGMGLGAMGLIARRRLSSANPLQQA